MTRDRSRILIGLTMAIALAAISAWWYWPRTAKSQVITAKAFDSSRASNAPRFLSEARRLKCEPVESSATQRFSVTFLLCLEGADETVYRQLERTALECGFRPLPVNVLEKYWVVPTDEVKILTENEGQKYAAFKRLSKTPFKESVQSPSSRRAFVRRMDGRLASDQDIEMLKRTLGVEVEREQVLFSRPPAALKASPPR